MNERLYNLMDWAEIEAVTYAETDNPHSLLGAQVTDEGILIQTFVPTAAAISVVCGKKTYPMELEDEAGFFAALIPGKRIPSYTLQVTFDSGDTACWQNPYDFEPQITEKELKRFRAGICYDIYEKLGAHPMTVKGVHGIYFAVWAPHAMRVRLVGDFDLWDGRRLPMRRLSDSGIFELFVPGLPVGTLYKYEIKAKNGLVFLKADPYANETEEQPGTASVVTELSGFEWKDQDWMAGRKKNDLKKEAMAVYEMHLASWKKKENGEIYNFRELAPLVASYVKKMNYTHVELMPVMEHFSEESWGYQVTGYYAPARQYGTPEDFMYFMDYLHREGIGVILDWVPAHFPKYDFGLGGFDGTCLYEHPDPRRGIHPEWGTYVFDYGKPEVSNFLIANALFWAEKYHADGLRMNAVVSMLYLDYGRQGGEWAANMYGGNENLEAVEFFKHLNSIFKKKEPGAVLIAEESAAWPGVTAPVEEDGLGFDFKWNTGWTDDLLGYMSLDPIFRGYHHGELTFSMIYAYSEDYMLTFSHDDIVNGKESMIRKMPGRTAQQEANLRAAYAYMVAHPGKKLLFMGQEFAQEEDWKAEKELDWALLEKEDHLEVQRFVSELNDFYRKHPALYRMDYDPEGFEWINSISANENMLVFTRNTEKKEDTLLVVANFSPVTYEKHTVGVPWPGKYKEIFNSDRKEYGGSGAGNPRVKQSRKEECDGRKDSITITVPPMSVLFFAYTGTAPRAATNREAKMDNKKKQEEL